jgi:superfamily II DNA or RNA helicase
MSNEFEQEIDLKKLRECQAEAYEAAKKHFSDESAENHVLIQLPTGTGKSALIAILPFSLAKKKVLILAPNLTLANQLANDLDFVENIESNIYKKLGILTDEQLGSLELFTLRLEKTANFNDIENHQIIISNYHQLSDIEKWFKGREDIIDLIIIDEAHHQKASTYKKIIQFFKDARIVSLTATPFRSDGQNLDGKNIYTYHFSDAIKKRYIRNIRVNNVTPREIELSFSDKDNKIYPIEEIVKMKEDAWFRRGIALSQDCCDSIAKKAHEKWLELKNDFQNTSHQIIASAISVRHAREFVKPAFEKLGLKVGIVNSKEDKHSNKQTIEKLLQGKIDVIVNVGMLGEGFDHNKLGVAAIFRPFATLNPYIQFIGRAIRKNENTEYCYVVSHLGLNQTKRFEEFKLFDGEDKLFLQTLLDGSLLQGGDDSFVEEDGKETRNSNENSAKITELGDSLVDFESQFTKNEDKIVIAEKMIGGLSDDEKKMLFERLGIDYDSVSVKKKRRAKPINERIASKNLLNEKEKSITSDIINELQLKMKGRSFTPMYDNFVWVKKKVSKAVNKRLNIESKQRKKLSNEQIEQLEKSNALEEIKEECLNYFRDKLKLKQK